MKQTDLFPTKAMALSDPAWAAIEPKRELVFPVGEPAGNDDRRWRFTPEDLAAVAADFAGRTEPAPVLYRHGDDPARGGMAAGWIDGVDLAPDGLYALIRYTERALSEIKDGAWGFRSPGFDAEQDEEGYWRPRRLSEVSLVNDPAIGGMPALQAKRLETAPEGALTAATNGEQEERTMGDSQTVTAAKKQSAAFDKPGILALLRETYSMPEAISDEMLAEMLAKALAGAPEPEMDLEKEDKPADLPNPLAEAAASVKPRIEFVEDGSAEKAVAEAEKAGKVTAAMRPGALKFASADPAGFASFVAASPVVAPAAGQIVTAASGDRTVQKFTTADLGSPEKRVQISAAARAVAAREHISMDAAYARVLA